MLLYFLSIVVVGLTGSVVCLVEDNFLLVVDTNNGTIHQLDLSDESVWQLPLSKMNYPVAVQFNPTDRKVYWTELRENIIRSAYLNGTDERTISTLHRGSFLVGLAIDMVSGLVYFTEGGADIIAAVTLDGRQHFTLVTEDMDKPQDIVLDLERGMMYWTDKGQSPRIEKAAMNGDDRSLVIDFEYLAVPVGLAIDSNGERLYWCDASFDKIQSISLSDGQKTSVIMHLHSPGSQHFGIALLGDNLYFTGVRKSYVSRINVKDSSPTAMQVGPSNFNMSSGITAYRSTRRTNGFEANSVCSVRNGDCEHVCLATPNGPQCACENGFTTAKTCSTPTYQCPLEFSGKTGHIRSPGYPKYTNNVYCAMILRLPKTQRPKRIIVFHAEDFDMAHKYDYLVILNNKITRSTLDRYDRFSVETTKKDVRMLFVTDGSIVGRGFHFTYEVYNVVNCSIDRPCQNGGTCINGDYCKCVYGVEGDWCERAVVDECASNPCQHGGTCDDKYEGFSCSCADLFTGAMCEISVDECASNPCQNGGTCVDIHNGFICTCTALFTGTVCESNLDFCRSHPCMNQGTCRNQAQTGNYQCDCAVGFAGDVCDSPILCERKPCQNGGICSQQGSVRTCSCLGSFSGVNCERSLIALVPDDKKKKLDVKLKLKDANFTPTLKDKASDDYIRLRKNVEDALKTIIDDKLGKGRYDITDVTFSSGSIVVKYEIEMLKDGASMESILTAIKQHNGTFAGHDMDTDSVSVTNLSAEPPEKKKDFPIAIIAFVGGAAVVIIVVCTAAICVFRRRKNSATQQEGVSPAFTGAQSGPNANRNGEEGDYAHLQGNRAEENRHIYGQLRHDRPPDRSNNNMHFENAAYDVGERTDSTYETLCSP